MNLKIKMKDETIEELDEICKFLNYVSNSDILSEKLILKIYENVKRLSSSPEIYPFFNKKDKYDYEYRKMVINKRYIILYYIDYDDKIVYIAHIFDGQSNYTRNMV